MPKFTYNGKSIFYTEEGHGDPLLILPGNTAASASHESEIHFFSYKYRVISLDFLGTGKSDRLEKWPENYWEEGAHQAHALLQHLGINKIDILGCSGGGLIALYMAIKYPECVNKLISDSVIDRINSETVQKEIIDDRTNPSQMQLQFWQYAHGEDWPDIVEADNNVIKNFAANGGDYFKGDLQKITCPVLLTASREDRFLPNVSFHFNRMQKTINDCFTFIYSEGNHPLMWSQPVLFRILTESFLEMGD